jgi:ABC-type antimicrobial peptide transport system permease subunit
LIGLNLVAIFPLIPWGIGAVTVVIFTILAAIPAVRRLLRKSPRELLSGNA